MKFVAKYPYRNENGETEYTIQRTEDKQFIPKTKTGATNLDGITRIPYNLPDILKAIGTGEVIAVVEGEKSADLLSSLGIATTCSAGGASWEWPRNWAGYFRGAQRVAIFADNDEPGREAAKRRARVIASVVNDVRIIELPHLAPKEDVWDWMQAYDIDDLYREIEYAPTFKWIQPTAEVNSEESVIAYLLRQRTENQTIFRKLTSEDFQDVFWKTAYTCIQSVASVGLVPDVATVAARMTKMYKLKQEEIETRLWTLWDKEFVFEAYETWIHNVLANATRKSVEVATVEVTNAIRDGVTGTELIDVWETVSKNLRRTIVPADPAPNIQDFLAVPTYHDWLLPGFLERKDRMILVAPEGAGKAVFLRQMAVKAAAGIDIWDDSKRVDPIRCLLIDRENSPNQIRNTIRRPFDEANKIVGSGWYDNLVIRADTSAINLLDPETRMWFEQQLITNKPDLVFCLPVYKMFVSDSERSMEQNAQEFCKIIDDFRERYGITVIFEAHAPTGTGDNRTRQMRPFGSSVWGRWPELGWGLQATVQPKHFDVTLFRGNRNDGVTTPTKMYWNPRPTGWQWLHDI